jgi:hypothetical protein
MCAFVASGERRSSTSPIGLWGWEAMLSFINPAPASTLPPHAFSPLNSHPCLG